MGLWLSDSRGSGFREIGHIYKPRGGYFDLDDIQWVPGEKRISFISGKALHVIDVD
jgi:hypothetical protein